MTITGCAMSGGLAKPAGGLRKQSNVSAICSHDSPIEVDDALRISS